MTGNDVVAGANDVVAGANDVVTGVNDMVAGVNDMVDGVNDMVAGVNDMVDGVNDMVDGVNDMVDGVNGMVASVNDMVACRRIAVEKPAPEAGKRTRWEKNLSTAGTRSADRCGGRQPRLTYCHGVKMFSINKLEYYHKSLPVNNLSLG